MPHWMTVTAASIELSMYLFVRMANVGNQIQQSTLKSYYVNSKMNFTLLKVWKSFL